MTRLWGTDSRGKVIHVSGLNYAKLRLFQLSILWRAGVSSLPDFSQVKLGPHEEVLRRMLLAKNAGVPSEYGCIMHLVTHDSKPFTALVVPPTWARLSGHRAYRFIFGGIGFVYAVTKAHLPAAMTAAFVQEDGTAVVMLKPITETGYLMK